MSSPAKQAGQAKPSKPRSNRAEESGEGGVLWDPIYVTERHAYRGAKVEDHHRYRGPRARDSGREAEETEPRRQANCDGTIIRLLRVCFFLFSRSDRARDRQGCGRLTQHKARSQKRHVALRAPHEGLRPRRSRLCSKRRRRAHSIIEHPSKLLGAMSGFPPHCPAPALAGGK